jgi:homoserine kinase type II
MESDPEIFAVLASYCLPELREVRPLGSAGGFSGAKFWGLETRNVRFCLRRWPRKKPNSDRLAYIHSVLRHVAENGFAKIPIPAQTATGQTFVKRPGFLWQVEPWLEGEANYHDKPSRAKLTTALQELATFHTTAASFASETGPAPGLVSRREQFDRLSGSRLDEIATRLNVGWPEFTIRARQMLDCYRRLAPQVRRLIAPAESIRVAIQPCIRDIWHDHVLFLADEVSGFIDFGALRMDHVAADISRLVGSLVGDDQDSRTTAIGAYQEVRPLSDDEMFLIDAYDRSSTLLSGMNWLQWICVERREFDNADWILRRLDEILARLTSRVTWL